MADLAGAILAALMVPYLLFEIQNGWSDLAAFRQFLSAPKTLDLQALDSLGALAGPATLWRLLPGRSTGAWFDFDALTWVLVALTLLGAAAALARRKARWGLVVCWLTLPVMLSLRHSMYVAPWYLLGCVPAMALLQGLAISTLAAAAGRLRPLATRRVSSGAPPMVLSFCLTAAMAASYVGFQSKIAANVRIDQYGIPLRYSQAAAEQVQKFAGGQLVYFAGPPNHEDVIPYLAGLPAFRRYSGRSVVLLPTEASWYMTQADNSVAGFFTSHFGAAAATVPASTGTPEFELFHIPGERALLTGSGFVPVQAKFEDAIAFEGYSVASLAAGQPSHVDLFWQVEDASALKRLRVSEFAHLVDSTGELWSTTPDLWNMTEPWASGDLVVWPLDLNLPPNAPLGGYRLDTGFYETFSQRPLSVTQPGGTPGTSIRLGPLRVAGPSDGITGQSLGTFGQNELALVGATWNGADVTLDWQATGKPLGSYTVFVHAVDGGGHLVAQHDGLPLNGSYPTNLWSAGDTVRDVHHLGVSPEPGVRLEIGLYVQPTGQRLTVHGPDVSEVSDHVLVDAAHYVAG